MEQRCKKKDISERRSPGGYSLLEALLSLLIISTCLTLIIPCLKTIRSVEESVDENLQLEIGLYQLQLRLAQNEITEINGDELIYRSATCENVLHVVNGQLIAQPGYNLFIRDVEDVCFYEEQGIVYMELIYEENEKVYPIAYLY